MLGKEKQIFLMILSLTFTLIQNIKAQEINCENPELKTILSRWDKESFLQPYWEKRPWEDSLEYWRKKTTLGLLRSSLQLENKLLKYSKINSSEKTIPFPSDETCHKIAKAFPEEWETLKQDRKTLEEDFKRWQVIGNPIPQIKWRSLLMTVLEIQYIRHTLKSGSWRKLSYGSIPKGVKYPELYPLMWNAAERGKFQDRLTFLLEKHPILNRHSKDIFGYGTELLVDIFFKIAFLNTKDAKNSDIKNYINVTTNQLVNEIKLQSCQYSINTVSLSYRVNEEKTIPLDGEQSCHIQAYQIWANQLPIVISKRVMEVMGYKSWPKIRKQLDLEIQRTQERWAIGIKNVREKLCQVDVNTLRALPEALGLAISEEKDVRKSKEAVALVCKGEWWRSHNRNLESGLALGSAAVFVGSVVAKKYMPQKTIPMAATLLSGGMMLGSNALKWKRQHDETQSSIYLRRSDFNGGNPFGNSRNLKILHNGATYLEMAVTVSVTGLQFMSALKAYNPALGIFQTKKAAAEAAGAAAEATKKAKPFVIKSRFFKNFRFEVPGVTTREALIFLSGFPAGRFFEVMEYREMGLNPLEDPVFYVNTAKDLISDLLMAKFFGGEGNLIHAGIKSSFSSILVNDIAENINYSINSQSIPEKSLVFDLIWGTTSAPIFEFGFFQGERLIELALGNKFVPPVIQKHALWVLPVITTLLQHATKEAKASAAKLRYVKDGHELVDAITGLRYMVDDLPFFGGDHESGDNVGFSEEQREAILDLLTTLEKSGEDKLFLDRVLAEILADMEGL